MPEITVCYSLKAQFNLSIGMQLKVQSELGDAAQMTRIWGMQLKIKGTVIMPFNLYVITLFAHSCDLTLMV